MFLNAVKYKLNKENTLNLNLKIFDIFIIVKYNYIWLISIKKLFKNINITFTKF